MELEFVAWLRARAPAHPRLRVGIGDDAAEVTLGRTDLAVTSDLLIDGVHFLADEHSAERIGRKAFAVNLSDLAAVAARPVGAVVSLALPRDGVGGSTPRDLAVGLVEGMLPLAERFDCPIVGGDTNVGPGPLVVSVTAFGEPPESGAVLRDGARPGDALFVTGPLGGSILGGHLDFTPRVEEAIALHRDFDLRAMMDLSDGLALDVRRLTDASGVGARIDAAAVPISAAAAELARVTGREPLDHALADGEDFELLLAVASGDADRLADWAPLSGERCARIGVVTDERDVVIRYGPGMVRPLEPRGYEH